jgi:hypothetical protein
MTPQINTIIPNKLFIGNAAAGQSQEIMGLHHITDIIDLRLFDNTDDDHAPNVIVHRHPLIDGFGNSLFVFSDTITALSSLMKNPDAIVYVHCEMGISRAPTVCATWWAVNSVPQISFDAALKIITSLRHEADPNVFIRSLARRYLHEMGDGESATE